MLFRSPLEELVEAEIVYATGIGDQTLSNANPFKSLPLVGLRNNNQISYLGPLNGQYGNHGDITSGAAGASSERLKQRI